MRLTKRAKSFLSRVVKIWATAEKEGIPIVRDVWTNYEGGYCHAGVIGLKLGLRESQFFSDDLTEEFEKHGAPKIIDCPACNTTRSSFTSLCVHLNAEDHEGFKKFTFGEAAKLLNKKYKLGVRI
ncbi:MAG: hypothetical protein ACREAE_04130 [Nitrosopumilaceae archaeon]